MSVGLGGRGRYGKFSVSIDYDLWVYVVAHCGSHDLAKQWMRDALREQEFVNSAVARNMIYRLVIDSTLVLKVSANKKQIEAGITDNITFN